MSNFFSYNSLRNTDVIFPAKIKSAEDIYETVLGLCVIRYTCRNCRILISPESLPSFSELSSMNQKISLLIHFIIIVFINFKGYFFTYVEIFKIKVFFVSISFMQLSIKCRCGLFGKDQIS